MGPVVAIDDNEDILELLEMLVTSEGFEIKTFKDGSEAHSFILANKPSAIITDQNLPGKTGIEILNDAHEKYGEILAFLISGEPRHLLIEGGCPQFVTILGKPFDTNDIIHKLSELKSE